MDQLKKMLNFFLSLRTAIWLLLAILLILFIGSLIMPLNAEFQALHVAPLFQWMTGNAFEITWWLWAAVVILSLLAANTLLCSIDSVIKKGGGKNRLLAISPQMIHAGFLFVMLAHLMSSYGSFKGTTFVAKGSELQIPNGPAVVFDDIRADADPAGYVTYWAADVRYFKEGRQIKSDVIQPNSPSFQDGFGIYIKTVRFDGSFPTALIEVSREPGAIWALVGGILFIVGMTALLVLKVRREEA